MSAWREAQQRLANARERDDKRDIHAAIADSKRLLTQGLRERFRPEVPVEEPAAPGLLRRLIGRRW